MLKDFLNLSLAGKRAIDYDFYGADLDTDEAEETKL